MLDVHTLSENGTSSRRLHELLCGDLTVDRRAPGESKVRTPFEFPDGDRYPIHLSGQPGGGGLRLSDRRHTLIHISYEHDMDTFVDEPSGRLLDRIVADRGLRWDGGAFCLDTTLRVLPTAIFRFGQALARKCDSTLCSIDNEGNL